MFSANFESPVDSLINVVFRPPKLRSSVYSSLFSGGTMASASAGRRLKRRASGQSSEREQYIRRKEVVLVSSTGNNLNDMVHAQHLHGTR